MIPDCVFCTLPQWDRVDGPWINIEPLNPVVPGHRLFIPRRHVANAAEMPDTTAMVFRAASRWGADQGVDFNLITSAGYAATQTVFHLHVHFVPRFPEDGLHLPWTGQIR